MVEIGDQPWEFDKEDEDHESKPRFDGFQLAPITLEDFRRQRKQQQAAAKGAEAKAMLEQRQRMGQAAREAALRDGVDVEALDRLYESLRAEGIDISNVRELHAALRSKGVDPDDRAELEDFARSYAAAHPSYASSGFSWAPTTFQTDAAQPPMPKIIRFPEDASVTASMQKPPRAEGELSEGEPDPSDDEEGESISTESMYSMGSWGKK